MICRQHASWPGGLALFGLGVLGVVCAASIVIRIGAYLLWRFITG